MNDSTKKVLVTTLHRGVFFGTFEEEKDYGRTVVLSNARCAIRFGTTGGFLQLAESGPTEQSKIGSVAPKITLYDVTSISELTEEAVEAWEKAK